MSEQTAAVLRDAAAQLLRVRAQIPETGRTDGVTAYRLGERDAYEEAARLLEERANTLTTKPGEG